MPAGNPKLDRPFAGFPGFAGCDVVIGTADRIDATVGGRCITDEVPDALPANAAPLFVQAVS